MKKVLILEDNEVILCGLEKLVKKIDNNLVVFALQYLKTNMVKNGTIGNDNRTCRMFT